MIVANSAAGIIRAKSTAGVVIGVARSLSLFCDHQVLHKVQSILKCPEHALYGELKRLPHGRRFKKLACKTS